MTSIFDIEDSEISNLGPTEATLLFEKLIRAEAYRIGLPVTNLSISRRTTVPDGGIDARAVGYETFEEKSNIFFSKDNSYQIKAGNFSPLSESRLRDELFGKKSKTDAERISLGVETQKCFDAKGTYVLVCFGNNFTPDEISRGEQTLAKLLKDFGIDNPKAKVWGISQIRDLIYLFPSLVFDLKGFREGTFQSHAGWTRNADMEKDLVKSDGYDERLAGFADTIRNRTQAWHIRITDEAGAGKTRFVLEATRSGDLAPLVVYTSAGQLIGSELFGRISQGDSSFTVILVADECDYMQSSELWNKLKNKGRRVVLITIFNKLEARNSDTVEIEIPTLDQKAIIQIIDSYGGVAKDRLESWADLAGSSPRFAHMIGYNLSKFPEDPLHPVDNLINRMIAGNEDPNSNLVSKRIIIIRYISLFKRFGYKHEYSQEAKKVWQFIHDFDANISWQDFMDAVNDLRNRKLLQGEATLYISPAALHIRLWLDWWKDYGDYFDFDRFVDIVGEDSQLIGWFYDMFRYAESTSIAQKLLNDLFGAGGKFEQHELLKKKFGGRFLIEISKIDPDRVLAFIEKYVDSKSREYLLSDTNSRRDLVWSLEYLVIPRHLFIRAAKVLLKLAEAENEKGIGNNASGVFVDLFSTGWGELAPSELSPIERLPVLEEALSSESEEIRNLAVKAGAKSLEARYFMRDIGTNEGVLVKKFKRWTPKTWGEIHQVYAIYWKFMANAINKVKDDNQREVVKALVNSMRDLAGFELLYQEMIKTYTDLLSKGLVEKEEMLKALSSLLHYDTKNLKDEILSAWSNFRDSLITTTIEDRLGRYVGMDMIEDHYDEDGKRVRVLEDKLDELAKELCDSKILMDKHLSWLVSTKAKKAYHFGMALHKHDKKLIYWPDLVKAYSFSGIDHNPDLIGGYLRGVFESDLAKWEELIFEIVENPSIICFTSEIIWRSGMSDKVAGLLLEKMRSGIIDYKTLGLFGLGGTIANLGEAVFLQWINFLIEVNTISSIAIALDLTQYYYLGRKHGDDLPLHPTLELVTSKALLEENEGESSYQMMDYNWADLVEAIVKKYPSTADALSKFILSSFGTEKTIFDRFDSDIDRSLNAIAKMNPGLLWSELQKYLEPPFNRTKFKIHHWLEGHRFSDELRGGALNYFPHEMIFEWVDKQPDDRARLIASICPQDIYENENSIALELLRRYGHKEEIRKELMISYIGGGWTGPESLHYSQKKEKLLNLEKRVNNPNVSLWVGEFVRYLDDRINAAKLAEERDYFG